MTEFPDLSELEELRALYLQNNAISQLPSNVLIPTSNKVERLDLSGNKFTIVPNEFLRRFTAMKSLNLCKCNIPRNAVEMCQNKLREQNPAV